MNAESDKQRVYKQNIEFDKGFMKQKISYRTIEKQLLEA